MEGARKKCNSLGEGSVGGKDTGLLKQRKQKWPEHRKQSGEGSQRGWGDGPEPVNIRHRRLV